MRGASALDELLAEFPDAPLHVQVVWEPVLATDIAPPLTRVLRRIDDPRVIQYWDPHRVVSAELVRAGNADPARYGLDGPFPPGFIAWDLVAVFDPGARWERDPPVPVSYGGPVVDAIADARSAIAEALAARSDPIR